jgi:hypothetical protein
LAAATAAFFLLAALSWLFLILSLILFAVNEQRSVCSFRRVAAASLASCAKTMEPAAHQAGMNLNAIYRHGLGLWPSWDIRYPSELSQHPRSGERGHDSS